MLHTLNTAWMQILAKQATKDLNKQFLLVTATEHEKFDTIDELWPWFSKWPGIMHMDIKSVKDLKQDILTCAYYNEEFPMYDDILVSHSIHDIFIKDFLGRHCKRKSC